MDVGMVTLRYSKDKNGKFMFGKGKGNNGRQWN